MIFTKDRYFGPMDPKFHLIEFMDKVNKTIKTRWEISEWLAARIPDSNVHLLVVDKRIGFSWK